MDGNLKTTLIIVVLELKPTSREVNFIKKWMREKKKKKELHPYLIFKRGYIVIYYGPSVYNVFGNWKVIKRRRASS